MKKLMLIAIMFLMVMSSCKKEVSTIQKSDELRYAEAVAQQLNIPVTFESVNVESPLKSTDSYIVVFKAIVDGKKVNQKVITTPLGEDTFSCRVIQGGVSSDFKVQYIYDSKGNLSLKYLNDSELKATNSWFRCMKKVFDDPFIGTVITVAGVAGGLGCLPCGGVAAFYTGVAAIGCLPYI